ncbi:MAG: DUF58 domain-containing protein [Gammaproteobacteria bacterium]|nr:DUF58 domain-containing protein [Gammaproteobacteria bacterium]
MNTRRRWRSRVGDWARRRQGEDAVPLALLRRRLYVLPTRAGLAFAALLLLMLLAGLNYTNSLGLLVTFLLAGVALIAMYECHRALHGLRIVAAEAGDAFEGTRGDLRLGVENTTALPRQGLMLRSGSAAATEVVAVRSDLPARQSATLCCTYAARRRGRQPIEALLLSTTLPLGLFRCWTWLHLPVEAIVYPAPSGRLALPAPRSLASALAARAGDGEEEWSALRPYQPGDSPRAVAWKAWARGAPLLVARYEALRGGEHFFDLAETPGTDLEARLRQLAAWIVTAEERGERYGLRIGNSVLPPSLGASHRQLCLRALALYPA